MKYWTLEKRLTGFSLALGAVLFLLPGASSSAAAPWPSKTVSSGANQGGFMSDGDPINMATGEYYFLDLGGPLPLDFGLYYGSQMDSKRYRDGLPSRFSGNRRGTLTGDISRYPAGIFVELGQGTEIVIQEGAEGWEAAPFERVRYQFKETIGYYYLMDPVEELVHTFKKAQAGFKYTPTAILSRSSGGTIGEDQSSNADISPNGRYVVFHSVATNMVSNPDTKDDNEWDVYRHDRKTGMTVLVSVRPTATEFRETATEPRAQGAATSAGPSPSPPTTPKEEVRERRASSVPSKGRGKRTSRYRERSGSAERGGPCLTSSSSRASTPASGSARARRAGGISRSSGDSC